MSDGTYTTGVGGPAEGSNGTSGKVDAAKDAAADLKDTTKDAAKDVAGTAKDEAASVARETKAQAVDLFHQTRRELSDQASTQQERVAAGLGALGDELGSMARGSDGGVAADLVQRVSDRAASAASWLGSRDPAGVLDDVKAYARRRPVVFIGAALIAGIAAGRLTRALIADAKDESDAASSTARPAGLESSAQSPVQGTPVVAAPVVVPSAVPVADTADAPLYDESVARFDIAGEEESHDRPHTL